MRWLCRAALLVVPLALGGCATQPAVMVYNGSSQPIHWPQPPDQPRYSYVGQLTGEENFPHPDEGRSLFAIFAGIGGAEQRQGLQRPLTGAVDEAGRVYVTDVSRQAVVVFDKVAAQLRFWEYAEPQQRFVTPTGIATDGSGGVWVSDADLGAVFHLDAAGEPRAVIGREVLQRPTGLALDRERGLLYVADTHAHNIKVFNLHGNMLATIGSRGVAPGEFNFPTHLAYAAGRLYVTDTMNARVQVLDTEGESEVVVGQRGLYIGNLPHPKGVAVDADGNIYAVESYYDHLVVYNRDGQLLLGIGGYGSAIGKFYLPAGVWTDSHGRVYVADMFNGRVIILQYLGGV